MIFIKATCIFVCPRAVGHELDNLVSVGDAAAVLEAFRGELLSNYTRWCG